MKQPFYLDPNEFERRYRAQAEALQARAFAEAETAADRRLIAMQIELEDAKIAILKRTVSWANNELPARDQAKAMASTIAVVLKSFASNCPEGAEALFRHLNEMLDAAPGEDGERHVSHVERIEGVRGGNA